MKYIIILLCIFFVTSELPDGVYELIVNEKVDFSALSEDEQMFGFIWKDFKIPLGEKVKKIMTFISTTKNSLGKWTGAFGSSTTVAPTYLTMSDDMTKSFTTNKGSMTWKIDLETQKIIQMGYAGELKWGVWWIDCKEFTIDKIVVFTEKYEGGYYDDE